MNRTTASLMLAAALVTPAAFAHVGDIGVMLINGRVNTGIVQEDIPGQEYVVPGQRVFISEFFDIAGEQYSDEPGLFSGDLGAFGAGITLPANASLEFDIRRAVRRWDAVNQNFDAIPGERIRLEFSAGAQSVSSPTTDALTAGFGIDTGATGGFDEHYDFYLDPAIGQTSTTDGLYLLELQLTLEGASGTTSEPFWIIFGNGSTVTLDDLEAAEEYVEQTLVPAPGLAGVLTLLGLAAARRKRR